MGAHRNWREASVMSVASRRVGPNAGASAAFHRAASPPSGPGGKEGWHKSEGGAEFEAADAGVRLLWAAGIHAFPVLNLGS